MKTLQDFIKAYEAARPDDVLRVTEEVSLDCLPTAYVLALEQRHLSPLLIFENVPGWSGSFVTNVFGSRDRLAFALGAEAGEFPQAWRSRASRPVAPVRTTEAAVQELVWRDEECDLANLPVPRHFDGDAGPYISAGVCIARDPDTGTANMAFARMQVKSARRLGISMHSHGHMWDYFHRAEQRGEGLDVAVVLGAHPAVLLAGASSASIDTDEMDIAGALAGSPIEVVKAVSVDIDVPAHAEIVIEGTILPEEREDEGPFGEYAGYSTSRSTRNVLHVKAITSRADPVYLDITPGMAADHLLLGRAQNEATIVERLQEVVPSVRDVYYPNSGTLFHAYISLDKQREGEAQQAATLLLGIDHYVKMVVVVDPDIDLRDERSVLWSIATRFQAASDLTVVDRSMCSVLDPSSSGGLSSKMILDATAPLEWDAVTLRLPAAAKARAEEASRAWQQRRARPR